jgi:hypothetical protein
MDGAFHIDHEALREAFGSVEHVLVRFVIVDERLFIDFRRGQHDEPAVIVLPQVRSLRARLRGIRQARPSLPAIEQLNAVAWPMRVGSLERLGALDVVRERLAADDAFEALRQLDEALEALEASERDEERRAITGDGYRTLWPSVKQP